MRRNEKKYEKHVRETAGDYTVKKSRALDNFAKVLTLIIAVAIWLYAVAVNDVTAIEKSVPLSVKESDGLLSSDLVNFDLTSVVIKGDAKVVDAMTSLSLGNFSAKHLVEDEDGVATLTLVLDTLPEGITAVKKTDGSAFPGGKVEVNATVHVGSAYELVVPKECVLIEGGNAEVAQESVTITVRTTSQDDTQLGILRNSLAEGKFENVTLFINLSDITVTKETQVPISVSFNNQFKKEIYEIFDVDQPYTIKVKPSESNPAVTEHQNVD